MPTRKPWPQFWLDLAACYASQATCPRLHVGAVVVRNRRLVGAGFNGSLPGEPHCEDVGCLMHDGHCLRTIHAERNALNSCTPDLKSGATLYCTHEPCLECFKEALSSGIVRIYYRRPYASAAKTAFEEALSLGVRRYDQEDWFMLETADA